MAEAIEDVSSLPGETISDQDGHKIGEIKEIYGVGDDETPMWVTVESSTGVGRTRLVFIPIARIKQQQDEIRVPYSFQHIQNAPEVEIEDELSEEDDQALRTYYAIGLADQEMVDTPQSYASQVPDDDGPAKKMDADSADGPVREIEEKDSAELAAQADEEEKEEKGDEYEKGRKATAEDVVGDEGSDSDSDSDSDSKDEDEGDRSDEKKDEESKGEAGGEESKDESDREEPKGESDQQPKDKQGEGEEKSGSEKEDEEG